MKGIDIDKRLVVTFNDTVLTNQPIGLNDFYHAQLSSRGTHISSSKKSNSIK